MQIPLLTIGIVLALPAAGFLGVAAWRFLSRSHRLRELGLWQSTFGMCNAIVATVFLTLSIIRMFGASPATPPDPTPQVIVIPGTNATVPAIGTEVSTQPLEPVQPESSHGRLTPEQVESTPTPEPLSVTITRPADGDSVLLTSRIDGMSTGLAPGQSTLTTPPWMYVLVRFSLSDVGESWWVQSYPVARADGSWNAFLSGLPGQASGTSLDICAIVSEELLPVGQLGGEPSGVLTRHCVSVSVV